MFELAMQNGLISINDFLPRPHKVVAATEDGKQVKFNVLQEIYEAYVTFLRRCEEYFHNFYTPPNGINSVGEHLALEIELFLSQTTNDPADKRLRQLIFNCLLKRETCITGNIILTIFRNYSEVNWFRYFFLGCDSMNEIDLLELGSYTELQGGNIVLPTGYSSILQPLLNVIPPESIALSQPVKTIHWRRKKFGDSVDLTTSKLEKISEEEDNPDSDDSDKTVTEVPVGNSGANMYVYN
jgi:spermine oxidase